MRVFGQLVFGQMPEGAFIPFDIINVKAETVNSSVILVEVKANGGDLVVTQGPFRAFGSFETIGFNGKVTGGERKTFYWSDKDWTSRPEDSLPSTRFEGRLTTFSVERGLPIRPDGERRVVPAIGDLSIINGDGTFDNIHNQLSVQAQPITVRLLKHEWSSYNDSTLLVNGLGENWLATNEKLDIGFLSQAYMLETPLAAQYAGTGGWEGGSENEGKSIPHIYGHCTGVSPELIDPIKLIYHVHFREVKNILAVYEGGSARIKGINRGSLTQLQLINPTPGSWDWISTPTGTAFRLGSSPSMAITCDVEGDAPGGVYVSTTAGIVQRLMLERNAPVDQAAFSSIATRFPGVVGIAFTDETSVLDAISTLCQGGEFYWGDLGNSLLAIGKLAPVSENAANVVGLGENFFLTDPETLTSPKAVWRVKVGYQRNWTVLSENDILPAPTVPESRRKMLQESEMQVAVADTVRKRKHPNVEEVSISSFYRDKNDAEALAVSILARLKPDQGLWRVTVGLVGYGFKLGQQLRVDWTRHGLMNKTVRLVGHHYRGPEVDLLVMG